MKFKILNWLRDAVIPETDVGDFDYTFLLFVLLHKRIPKKKSKLWNDRLFYFKNSSEIENPLRVFISDKEYVKEFVKAEIGSRYNIPTLGTYKSFEEFEQALNTIAVEHAKTFVIKPTHMSGQVIFKHQGEYLNQWKRETIKSWFEQSYYSRSRERNYKTLVPKIIIEPLVFGKVNQSDIKVLCMNGSPKVIQVDEDRHTNHRRYFYDTKWRLLDFTSGYAKKSPMRMNFFQLDQPKNLKQILEVATKLSKKFTMIRVDMYTNGKQIKIGELTNTSCGASDRFVGPNGELQMSKLVFGE